MERFLIIPSKLIEIREVRRFLGSFYSEARLQQTSFNKVFLGLSEAVNNAILHGNKLDEERKVCIKVQLFDNQIWIEVEDEGEGFFSEMLADPTLPENIKLEHGRGIFLIKCVASELVFKNNGRKVQIKFDLSE